MVILAALVLAPPSAHDAVLSAAAQLRCGRIGIFVGADSFDYPRT